ncbi:hypothetical protein Tco_1293978 [Tanacetum coccineum]
MLAPGNYVQWNSRIKRYIDTKPNHELIHYYLENQSYEYRWIPNPTPETPATPGTDGGNQTRLERVKESYATISEEIKKKMDAEAEAIQIILTGIDNDIYSTVDACPNVMEMWKAIERSQAATRNRGKVVVNSPSPTYDPEPEAVADDEASSKEKEIDKLMDLISMSFKKIYKPTNNNLRTSSNTRNTNVDNTQRSNKGTRENVDTHVVQQIGIQCFKYKEFRHVARECKKAKRQRDSDYDKEKMLLCKQEEAEAVDNSGPIFDTEPLEKVHTIDDHYNVFANERQHLDQPESINDTYVMEQDDRNISPDSSVCVVMKERLTRMMI